MRKILFFAPLFFVLSLSAQENLLFDTTMIQKGTKLIGRYPQYDKKKVHQNLNFIIEDAAVIRSVITDLTLGKEEAFMNEEPGFMIAIVHDYAEEKNWAVNPGFNSVMHNGHAYAFNVSKLKLLAKKYPFDYRTEKLVFKSDKEYEQYLGKQKKDSNFLFAYGPSFRYEGSFEVAFPKNDTFPHPAGISDYLDPLIEKIVSKDEYRVIYELSEINIKNRDQYTMKIIGSKKLYESLVLKGLKKEEWMPTVEDALFFYRIK